MNRWRRRRVQSVTYGAKPFIDSTDSIVDPIPQAGAPFPALTELPRRGVRRLLEWDEFGSTRDWPRGMGGGPAPHASPRARQVVRVVRAGPLVVRAPVTPLQARRRKADWLAFRQLRITAPGSVAFCVRRKVRREVMFAKQIAGRRGLGRGGVRRSESSNWSC